MVQFATHVKYVTKLLCNTPDVVQREREREKEQLQSVKRERESENNNCKGWERKVCVDT